jgi:probable O-glycosylation ligase (exosortase A-associated)
MTVPLLRYLQLQARDLWLRWGLVAGMVLCGVAALGSHSRGALLAVTAMLMFLWFKGRSKLMSGLVLILVIPVAINFMPEAWTERMRSIQNYEQDGSAMSRLKTWGVALSVAADRPIVGGGFDIYTRRVFERYAPGTIARAAHSIYFQVLGEHGYVGLSLFLLLWLVVWRDASWIIRQARNREGFQWAADLAAMIQVSLVGYAVGGTFLNLAYYDVPYNLLVAIVLTRVLIAKAMVEADSKEPASVRQSRASTLDANAAGVPALPRPTS